MISAGRVLLMPKGAYDASTTYELLDIVSYNGSSYIAKGTTTGNLPTNTTYWQLSAYGGNAANVASNFAELETTSIAVAVHNVDDLFIDENSQLMITTQKINIGDSIVSGTNCTPTSVETLLNNIATYFANLDATDRKLKAIAEIEVQTDLHTLTIGEYFKSDTSFYVTNAPTGIDSEITAVFRLTVEAAYDDEGAFNAPMLFTLRTLNGKVYKQAFDGANWSSWAQEATEAEINTLQYDDIQIQQLVANFQGTLTANKNYSAGDHFVYQYNEYELDSSVSSGSALVIGTNCHATGDVSSQIQTLSNHLSAVDKNGAKNLLLPAITGLGLSENPYHGITFTLNADGSITCVGTATDATGVRFNGGKMVKTAFGLADGRYYMSGGVNNDLSLQVQTRRSDNTVVSQPISYGGDVLFEITPDIYYLDFFIFIPSGAVVNGTIKPMVRLASDPDSTYVPYAKTNRELTDGKADKSDLASINITGTTNNTGNTIPAGTYFYLNGTLVRAKNTDIANNATLTLNTNYEVVTAGALNELIVFNNRGNVSSSSLENYTQEGIFQVYITDVLSEGWGLLIVTTDTAVITQTLINGGGIAFRKYSANQSAWSTWTKTLFS